VLLVDATGSKHALRIFAAEVMPEFQSRAGDARHKLHGG
jgi:hypothetical protein